MRKTLIGAAILVVAGAGIHAQDQPSPFDAQTMLRLPTTLPNCGVNTVIMALARASQVAIGFEESRDESEACAGHFARVEATYASNEQPSLTVRQVLDQLMVLAPAYQWIEMDGVAVIRPAAAWTDASNVLNGRVAALHIADATVGETLATMLRHPTPHDEPISRSNFGRPLFQMAFDGGTMVEALNALVRSQGRAGWMARVLHPTGVDGTPALQLAVRTFKVGDRTGVDGAISMGAPLSRLVAAR